MLFHPEYLWCDVFCTVNSLNWAYWNAARCAVVKGYCHGFLCHSLRQGVRRHIQYRLLSIFFRISITHPYQLHTQLCEFTLYTSADDYASNIANTNVVMTCRRNEPRHHFQMSSGLCMLRPRQPTICLNKDAIHYHFSGKLWYNLIVRMDLLEQNPFLTVIAIWCGSGGGSW